MSEHYTRNTLECTAYCGRCQKNTQHRVDAGRQGPCLDCIQRIEKRAAEEKAKRLQKEADAAKQPNLFEKTTEEKLAEHLVFDATVEEDGSLTIHKEQTGEKP